MSGNEEFLRRFGALSDEQWVAKLFRSTKERLVDGVAFPSFPDGSLQRSFVGADGEEALREAYVFYQEIQAADSHRSGHASGRFRLRLGTYLSVLPA
jgi:hypothetical protein